MSDVTISYNGSSIATLDAAGTKRLKTGGKVCLGDIDVTYAPNIPSKGFVPTAWNSDGIATEGVWYGTTVSTNALRNASGNVYPLGRLTNISFADAVTSIGENAFTYCTSLALTSLPNTITRLYTCAFNYCRSLALTSLPSSLTRVDESAFEGCTALALTSLPNSLERIVARAFYGCPNLAISEIPASVTNIGGNIFYGAAGITSIRFKGTPSAISTTALAGCANLADIYVPWASTDAINANAPWGATNATMHYNETV